jgi:predicted component of type VI protein secretion system
MRTHLERRLLALSDEVRHYPTPIARCDEQLTALLEARTEVARLLSQADDGAFVEEFARYADRWDDPEARQLLA